ncbi:MAG: hypothetical protein AAF449_07420 [Myxococcota bacterium]
MKGKVERFYWREITKTLFEFVSDWLRENEESAADIIDFGTRFPEVKKRLQKAAKAHWQARHRSSPKYSLREPTKAQLKDDIDIPTVRIEAPYTKVQTSKSVRGAFLNAEGVPVGAEEIAAEHYVERGFRVVRCERAIPSTWYAAFFCDVVQNQSDPRQRLVGRMSTVGFGTTQTRPYFEFLLPEDFGSAEYFHRRRAEFAKALDQLRKRDNLVEVFDSALEGSLGLRDYLWAAEKRTVAAAREVLSTVPRGMVFATLDWLARHFWDRQPGWPDFFVHDENDYFLWK